MFNLIFVFVKFYYRALMIWKGEYRDRTLMTPMIRLCTQGLYRITCVLIIPSMLCLHP